MIGSVYDVSDQWEKTTTTTTIVGWQTLPQECKHVLVGRELLVIAFGARPTFGGEPPKPPELTTNIAS